MPLLYFIFLHTQGVVGILGLIRFKKLNISLRYIEGFVLYSYLSGWIEHILGSYYHVQNLWLFHFNTSIELFLLLKAFFHWRTGEMNGKFIQWSFYFYIIIWIIGIFTFEPLTMYDSYSEAIAQIIQIGFCMWLLIAILKDESIRWKNDPRFWIASGMILYVVCTFLLFGFFDVLLLKSPQLVKLIWSLNWSSSILAFAFIARAFLCKPVSMHQDVVPRNVENY